MRVDQGKEEIFVPVRETLAHAIAQVEAAPLRKEEIDAFIRGMVDFGIPAQGSCGSTTRLAPK